MKMENVDEAVKLFLSSQDALGRDFEPVEKPRKPMDNFDGKYAALKFRMMSRFERAEPSDIDFGFDKIRRGEHEDSWTVEPDDGDWQAFRRSVTKAA